MRRLAKRLRVWVVLLTIVLATLAVSPAIASTRAQPAFARTGFALRAAHPMTTSTSDYYYDNVWHGFVDVTCNYTHLEQVTFYWDANWSGYKTEICSDTSNFCDVPVIATSPPVAASCIPFSIPSLNDVASSVFWRTNTGECVALYSDANRGGRETTLNATGGSISNLGNTYVGNDTVSSMHHFVC